MSGRAGATVATKKSGRGAPRARGRRERLPVIEVDVDDEAALSAIAEQVVTAIFELTGAAANEPGRGARPKARKKARKAAAKKAAAKKAPAKKAAAKKAKAPAAPRARGGKRS